MVAIKEGSKTTGAPIQMMTLSQQRVRRRELGDERLHWQVMNPGRSLDEMPAQIRKQKPQHCPHKSDKAKPKHHHVRRSRVK